MKTILNNLPLAIFDMIARAKGYRFEEVKTNEQYEEICKIAAEDGFFFPEELAKEVAIYKKGTINFIAYYKNTPVGTVRLSNPKVINRPYELYGVDGQGEHFEIQSLCVKKEYREGSQFVMLGLFKAMYAYSVRHSIRSWNSCGTRSVYLTIRRYCRKIEITDIDFSSIKHPLTQYLYKHGIIDTYFTMDVAAFAPGSILRKMIRQLVKRIEIPDPLKSISYGAYRLHLK